jgi:hypothetical protein
MRTGSLRSEGTTLSPLSKVTVELPRRRRIGAPANAEVVTVSGNDDWFALFADEKNAPPRAARPVSREPARIVARETALPSPQPEPLRIAAATPHWLTLAVLRWRSGPWPAIAGGAAIILSAGLLVVAARNFGGDRTPAPTVIQPSSATSASSWTIAPISTAVETPPVAASAPRPSSSVRSAPPPGRSATRSGSADNSARRAVVLPVKAQPVEGRRATPTPPASRQPTPTPTPPPTPRVTPISTPIPTPVTAPLQALSDATAGRVLPPTPLATPSRPSDSALIRSVLDRYRQAYGSLDADAVAGVWPSVNSRSLARAFGQLASQRFEFTDCRIDVSAAHAQATCTGRASFVPKVGGRAVRSENREWAFVLARLNDDWIISRAESR